MSNTKEFDLSQLVEEFAEFQPDKSSLSMDGKPLVHAMADLEPEFVIPFIKEKMDKGGDKETAIHDLYAFLFDKRYYSRLDLLYFAAGLLFQMRFLRLHRYLMKRVRLYLKISYRPVIR